MNVPAAVLSLPALARRLKHIDAFKIPPEGATLKSHESDPSAVASPYYVNLRIPDNKGPLTFGEVEAIAAFFYDYLRKQPTIRFDAIAGLPRAGEPFAKALQGMLHHGPGNPSIPLVRLHKEEGPNGRKIGKVTQDRDILVKRVLVVDDVISAGDTKLEGIERLRSAGYTVEHVLVFLDRQQGGRSTLARQNIVLHNVTTVSALLDIYEQGKLLTPDELERIRTYVASFE